MLSEMFSKLFAPRNEDCDNGLSKYYGFAVIRRFKTTSRFRK